MPNGANICRSICAVRAESALPIANQRRYGRREIACRQFAHHDDELAQNQVVTDTLLDSIPEFRVVRASVQEVSDFVKARHTNPVGEQVMTRVQDLK